MGQKSSDFLAIPLCSGHHREHPDSYHRLREPCFARQNRIDLYRIATNLKQVFDRQIAAALPTV
jgi:hypothetical protein